MAKKNDKNINEKKSGDNDCIDTLLNMNRAQIAQEYMALFTEEERVPKKNSALEYEEYRKLGANIYTLRWLRMMLTTVNEENKNPKFENAIRLWMRRGLHLQLIFDLEFREPYANTCLGPILEMIDQYNKNVPKVNILSSEYDGTINLSIETDLLGR